MVADVQVVYLVKAAWFLSANSAITKGCDNLAQAQAWNDYLVTQACQQLIASETAVATSARRCDPSRGHAEPRRHQCGWRRITTT